MLCINPYRKPTVEYGCGQCMSCRVNRRRTWAARIQLESLAFRESSFVTLTYSDEHLPPSASLSKAHWREFTKGIGYRYFGCGEYGDHTHRPHYHFVLFGLPWMEAESFVAARWRYGFVSVRPFCAAHALYVAAYTTKKLGKLDDPRLAPGQIPEFASMSRRPAIGTEGVASFGDWLVTRDGSRYLASTRDAPAAVRLNGSLYPIGRTLRGKLREAASLPSDDPVRTMARESAFKASRADPALVARIEKKRHGHYETLRAKNLRRRGTL